MQPVVDELKKIGGMIVGLLHSRKFYALAASLVTDGFALSAGKIDAQTAVLAAIGALAAYTLGTGLDDSGKTSAPPAALK